MEQPGLFDEKPENKELERALLFALGDFQSRNKVLADRELALDRLRGAFRRAFERFAIDEPEESRVAEALERLGARIKRIPTFIAKHPYRVTVDVDLAARGAELFRQTRTNG
jgi:signal recognition particle subunit SEC65